MGRRSRRRAKDARASIASGGPSSFADLDLDLDLDPAGAAVQPTTPQALRDGLGVLTLRTALSPGTRAEYAAVARGERSAPSAAREDGWHRVLEFLYERVVTGWTVAGVPTTGQKALLARLRAASPDERAAIRQALRAHLAEHFPDLQAP